jgi:four helix bundle protein
MKLDELNVYKLASEIGDDAWLMVEKWSFFEKDTIGKQLVRAADSISANIAEGFGRYFYKENRQFCYYARGSMMETQTWVNKARNRGLISEQNAVEMNRKLDILAYKLNAYIKSIGTSSNTLIE